MSGDPEQEYFADGLVEDLITSLSKVAGLFVIARNSTFAYKGKTVDIRQVAKELGVRYVLEGSVRKAANRLRITGQLVEGTDGTHVWADKFEGAARRHLRAAGSADREHRRGHGADRCGAPRSNGHAASGPTGWTPTISTCGRCRTLTRTRRRTPTKRCGCSTKRCSSTRTTPPHTPMRPGATSSASCAAASIPRTGRPRSSTPSSR